MSVSAEVSIHENFGDVNRLLFRSVGEILTKNVDNPTVAHLLHPFNDLLVAGIYIAIFSLRGNSLEQSLKGIVLRFNHRVQQTVVVILQHLSALGSERYTLLGISNSSLQSFDSSQFGSLGICIESSFTLADS